MVRVCEPRIDRAAGGGIDVVHGGSGHDVLHRGLRSQRADPLTLIEWSRYFPKCVLLEMGASAKRYERAAQADERLAEPLSGLSTDEHFELSAVTAGLERADALEAQ